MSKELKISYQGSHSVYAILQKVSTGQAWNGTALETWADANIATYDLALSSLGGDLYATDFPATAPVATYSIFYYAMAGAAPATTDKLLKHESGYWNGTTLLADTATAATSATQTTVFFSGTIDAATDGTNEDTLQQEIVLSNTSAVAVTSAWVRSGKLPSSAPGTTTIVIADAPWDETPGESIEITLSGTEKKSAPVSGSITMAAGAPVYIYFTAGGNHSDLTLALEYTGAGAASVSGTGLVAADVIQEARNICGDSVTPYNQSDAKFIKWVNWAQIEALRLRPDLRYDSDGDFLTTDQAITGTGQYLVLPTDTFMAVAYLTASRYASSMDAERVNREQADAFYNEAKFMLGVAQ